MSHILLTFDVEDWFQVENLRPYCPPATWDQYELRVERNTHRLLDLLDSIQLRSSNWSNEAKNCAPHVPSHSSASAPTTDNLQLTTDNLKPTTNNLQPTTYNTTYNLQPTTKPTATFFILGWLAERLPHLVREIRERGHEVASHGQNHILCKEQTSHALYQDLEYSKKLLEDVLGAEVSGYRAPSFSINNQILQLIEKAGYGYDSSYNESGWNKRYGKLDLSEDVCAMGSALKINQGFFELPLSNLSLGGKTIPLAGGGYFRFIPGFLFQAGVKRILRQRDAYIFYMHPWEIDPGQPRVHQAEKGAKFRHYLNLHKTEDRLRSLIHAFSKGYNFISCSDYIHRLAQ